MAGFLSSAGHVMVESLEEAEAVIVNTCGFIRPAVEENIETILELAQLKEEGVFRLLLVTGCLTQRYQAELAAELPEVDGFAGTGEYHRIADLLAAADRRERPQYYRSPEAFISDLPRSRAGSAPSAYLKIAEGCPRSCSYCVIPQIRGKLHSRDPEEILAEAKILASEGVREIVLVAQDTTAYGLDLAGRSLLSELLQKLATIEGLHWIRFLYAYPELVTDELLETMAQEEKVCAYLDLPLQHVSGEILRSMGRKGSREEYLELLEKVRTYLPEAAIRSTFIVGYPGEREEDFQALLEFVDTVRFNQLATFTYYPEEGTRAAQLPNQVPPEVARKRLARLTNLQEIISTEVNHSRVGKVEEVLVETANSTERIIYGRSFREAPEIDSVVVASVAVGGKMPAPGDLVQVKITDADSQELTAVLV